MSRPRGSTTKRFTGEDLRALGEDLTALGFALFRETRGCTPLAPMRRRAARVMRQLREVNHRFCQ